MNYISTRGKTPPLKAKEVIKTGIAPDGGLFVPDKTVKISLDELAGDLSYRDLAFKIIAPFLSDYSEEELLKSLDKAYNPGNFNNPEITPLHKISETLYFLELWHGPTCAFKDVALQLMPHLLTNAVKKSDDSNGIVILVATSGDTGKAALEGFRDIPGTKIAVFYPEEGVSEIQKRQMITQEGKNVKVIAVKGNFDDAQSGVKAVFADDYIKDKLNKSGYRFSSANSINWGRLVPQIVYYFRAYLDLLQKGFLKSGDPVNFVVPTGNFGNILAGFYAREAGLPVNRLICAANSNNVLTDLINTGTYNRKRNFIKTISPSMDILISSNLERLLFEMTDKNSSTITSWMEQLASNGSYSLDEATATKINAIFWSDFADDTETIKTIRKYFTKYRYLIDTHTAVAASVYEKYRKTSGDATKTVIVSTANPFKFNLSVARAVLDEEIISGKNEFELLKLLAEKTGQPIPRELKNLNNKPVLHRESVTTDSMKEAVLNFIKE